MSMQSLLRDNLFFFDSQLFKDVQLAAIYKDSKTFADAIPKIAYQDIFNRYEQQCQRNNAVDLKEFVEHYFTLPTDTEVTSKEQLKTVKAHISHLWKVLKKPGDEKLAGSLLPLKHAYIVPGGRFREIYYWDSYFTALGLIESGHFELVNNMLDNFVELLADNGCIPNGNRAYYYSRSQPPILSMLVNLLMPYQQDKTVFIKRYVTAIVAEYNFWMRGSEQLTANINSSRRTVYMPDGSVLNRYWDDEATPRPESYREDIELAQNIPQEQRESFYRNIRAACESGWDFSSRWLKDSAKLASIQTTDIVPVDLNCLLYQVELHLSEYYHLLEEQELRQHFFEKSLVRKNAIQKYLWSDALSYFVDFNIKENVQSPVLSLAGVLPLFVEIANHGQAKRIKEQLENNFLKAGGLITTIKESAQQWDSPNGWAPLHWFTVQGLRHYQFDDLAIDVSQRWLKMIESFFQKSGKLMEKYNVCQQVSIASGGEYEVQEGFGWTNGVTLAFYAYLENTNP